MDIYTVKKIPSSEETLILSVPASKSILNRALFLAAFTDGITSLHCGNYGQDTRDLLSCLTALGIQLEPASDGIVVHGRTKIPSKSAILNVGSAGTVARFLTTILAFRGGEYEMYASSQMEKRPMEILTTLEHTGVQIDYLKKYGHFPFRMHSNGMHSPVEINTDTSTQYASGLMLAAAIGKQPFLLNLTGKRTNGSYIALTEKIIDDFGGDCNRSSEKIFITPISRKTETFTVEPDMSAASYFYALSLLLHRKVLVRDIHFNCEQPDFAFLRLLETKGVKLTQCTDGILADGTDIEEYDGFDVDLRNFSDQTLTVAALAPFATSPSRLRGIRHIRKQECDRVNAILENLSTLGIPCSATEDEIIIEPSTIHGGRINTFNDHRVAMAFALIGLKTGNIVIENPLCCQKTFENYFEILDEITK